MMMPTRRSVVFAAAACAAAQAVRPLRARTGPWNRSADAARKMDQLHALIISRGGATELAEAFRGPRLERTVNVKSVSKTIVAAVTGAALDRGVIAGLETTLGVVAPKLVPEAADARVRGITIEDLLTMRTGLEPTSGANYGRWIATGNWVAHALSRPMVAEPGGRMLYSTGNYHVLGAALARASGETLLRLTRDWLGEPLGVEIPPWTRDPQGYYIGGNEMAMSPMVMLRFGEMIRQGGMWNGAQVLSADWISRSMQPRTRSPFSGLDYGYGWFLGEADGSGMALARGYGGQIICIVPDLELTVVITSDITRPARSEGYFGDLMRLIGNVIVPEARAD